MSLLLKTFHLTHNKIQNSHPAYDFPPNLPTRLLSDFSSSYSRLPSGVPTTQASSHSLKQSKHSLASGHLHLLFLLPGTLLQTSALLICSSSRYPHSSTSLGPLLNTSILEKLCLIATAYFYPFVHLCFFFQVLLTL